MPDIDFSLIPIDWRVPGVFVEFDPSQAMQGLPLQPYKVLLVGNRLAGGSVAALVPTQVVTVDQARQYFGNGSVLAAMVEAFRANDAYTELWCIAADDPGGGTARVTTIGFTGTSAAAGTFYFYAGGRRYTAAVASGATGATAATAIAAAINADDDAPITAAESTGDLVLTAKHTGELCNAIDYRWNYYTGEKFPPGIAADTPVETTAGAGVVDVSTITAVMGDTQYNVIGSPYTDAAAVAEFESLLLDRWGPMNPIDGHLFVAADGDFSTMSALGQARNSPFSTILAANSSPTLAWGIGGALAGNAAYYLAQDPARPLQTLRLVGVLAPSESDRFTLAERNLLLGDGISTSRADRDGTVRLERVITTYQTNAYGEPDTSYLDVETRYTLSYLRYSFRSRFLNKFPRHKLADDGSPTALGTAVLTPKTAKAECVALFRQWEAIGLVENLDQFKRDIRVERASTNPNRLDFYLPPDLVNQFRIGAAIIGFRL
ncbi:MAG: phage tail sheath C-terminal domain-containing protein [Planctomycetota bacterium]